jgi:tetratricopeptide (TPR) repeat protein
VPVPVTYEWSGPWEQLRSGIVLLTWKAELTVGRLKVDSSNLQPSTFKPSNLQPSTFKPSNLQPSNLQPSTFKPSNLQPSTFKPSNLQPSNLQPSNLQPSNLQPSNLQSSNLQRWLHDHGIAMGQLHPGRLTAEQSQGSFLVIEQMAMLPPADIAAGTYTLEVTYLNRETGENYAIAAPPVRLNIAPNFPATPAPELDLVTQLRTLAANLPKGRKALDPIFDEIGRINQYDPVQNYTLQAALALEYRLQQEPQNLDWAYALALSKALRRDAQGAIRALKQVVQLDSQNPYAHAYLAFVYLYQWRGKDAQNAIQPALALNPNIPEIQAISGVAALLQGNVFKAWNILHQV